MNDSLSIVTNETCSFQINEVVSAQFNEEKKWEYGQKPEVKARNQKSKKISCQINKEKQLQYSKKWYQKNKERVQEYNQRSEVKVRSKKYGQKPEVKARNQKSKKISCQINKEKQLQYSKKWYQKNKEKLKKYKQRPEVKAKKREYDKKRYQANKEKKKAQEKLQFGHIFNSKQNFELNNLNYDDLCNKEVQNIAWDVLETQLYSEKEGTELDQLLEEAQSESTINTEQNLLLSNEGLSCNLIDDMCSEQIMKTVSNNLEPEQLNLLNYSIDQLLVNRKLIEQNFEWNSNIVITSNLVSDTYDYNLVTKLIP